MMYWEDRVDELTLEALGQEVDVGGLVAGNGLDVVVDLGVEAGALEVLLRVLLEALAVEGVLEMLKGQSILENVGCVMLDGVINQLMLLCSPSVMPARLSRVGAAVQRPAATTAATVA